MVKPVAVVLSALAMLAAVLLAGCSAPTSGAGGTPTASARRSAAPASSAEPATATSPPVRPAAIRTPCTGNRHAKWVLVSLRRQHLWLCARARVVRDAPVTSGMVGRYTRTPTGHYRIQGLNRNSTLTLDTGQTFAVKYWIPFDAPLFGFHDASWQDVPYGSPAYRTRGSHGCVHVPLPALRFLYSWAAIGTPVTIRA